MTNNNETVVELTEIVPADLETLLGHTLPILTNLRDKWMSNGRRTTDNERDLFVLNLAIINMELMIQKLK